MSELEFKIRKWLDSPDLEAFARRCYDFGQSHLLSRHRVQYMLDKMIERGVIGG